MKKVFLLLVLTLLSMVAKANPVIPSRWDRYLGMTAAMTQDLSPRLVLFLIHPK